MALRGAFTALLPLCLLIGASAGTAPPPAELTVSCDNTNVVASWKYSQPHTRFEVLITGVTGEYLYNTTAHHFDLSPFIWKSERRYMEVHAVNVTATRGSERSAPARSKSFTFNDQRPAHIKCKLSFPPVDLKVDDSVGSVTFANPLNFYPELQHAIKPDTAAVRFTVSTKDHKSFPGECGVRQKYCELGNIVFPEDGEQCVTLTGRLLDGNNFRHMVFNETGLVCPDTQSYVVIVVVPVVLLLATFIIISFFVVWICLTKSWTLKREPLAPPDPLVKEPRPSRGTAFFTVEREVWSPVRVIEEASNHRRSVSSEEDDPLLHEDRTEVHCPAEGVEPYGDGGLLENSSQKLEPGSEKGDDDSEDTSVNTETSAITSEEEEEEEARSPYDSPQNLLLCSSGEACSVEGQHREDDGLR